MAPVFGQWAVTSWFDALSRTSAKNRLYRRIKVPACHLPRNIFTRPDHAASGAHRAMLKSAAHN